MSLNSERAARRGPDEASELGSSVELLKQVLEHLDSPAQLDGHPWAGSLWVQDQSTLEPELTALPPGPRLAAATARFFAGSLPPAPPRQGKRLDTRWAQYGLLASRYFSPYLHSLPYPDSLREAWHGMDAAILSFAFNGNGEVDESARARYRLVSNEPEAAPESTLSDWHRKGIERLAAEIERREQRLQSLPRAMPGDTDPAPERKAPPAWAKWTTLAALAALLVLGVVLGGMKARRVYDLALAVREDAYALKALSGGEPEVGALKNAGPALADLRGDYDLLKAEVQPFLGMGRWLNRVPTYGGDLASAESLLQMADHLLQAAELSHAALVPLMEAVAADQPLGPQSAVSMLKAAGPELAQARESFRQAADLRASLDAEKLSPRTRGVLEAYLDPLLPRVEDGLDAALALPGFLGATSEGPRTYLLLAQNEDELRPTGGFITMAGNMVVKDGRILSLTFKDSGTLDNWAMPYPPAPWQLQNYMNSTVLTLRDSNWYTDFPASAEYAEYLYSYHSFHSVDGVIAFDQQSLVMLLQVLGPVEVEGQDGYVDASNVLTYMRQGKSMLPVDGIYPEGWTSKYFLGDLAEAIFAKVYASSPGDWPALARYLIRVMDEKHIIMQVDDPALAAVLDRNGWNGAVKPEVGDFLMVVDSNVGFNKTNAVVTTRLFYDADLTDPAAPTGSVTVLHENDSPVMPACEHWDKARTPRQERYPIDDCYWDYMRVYAPEGAVLTGSDAQTVPAAWMIQEAAVKARVDVLDEEEIAGLQAFGTLLVVPGGDSVASGLTYSLSPEVLTLDPETGRMTYRLTVKKQPGTTAVPITIRLHLPTGASLDYFPVGAVVEGEDLLLELDLLRDLHLEVGFYLR